MRIFLIAALLLLSGCAAESNWRDQNQLADIWMFSLLKLRVVPTFQSPVVYEVSHGEPYTLNVTKYDGAGGYNWGKAKESYVVNLTAEQYTQIVSALEKTILSYPLKDNVGGKDGSTWVLESTMYHYVKLASWSPTYETNERGYSELVNLRNLLAKIGTR